ncbi:MAG: D-alanine--D-alanine ligase [Candidatus Bipolaricaulota bacterium]|nr:D-alanine--D-alanine ligase [Candidatus Bipolaricaulota bacterium]MCS7275041.1 D-alanine--D-alanine ligase [Candidatus Bipolaricaulota bacterium]MDW8110369.1 D-alanine--D-alanine ligase [Candidatus Bipolaricaulota bacterium]MDW8328735.1 D-alanine--D-alanine ligase [Candidatus Bipolaricaulota bacterium]
MNVARQRIGVLMGGLSPEREVSLRSGGNVCAALARRGYRVYALQIDHLDQIVPALYEIDVAFICLHGGVGEDGTLQALLEVLGIPYVGSGVLASALAMNKLQAKRVFLSQKLPTAPWVEYRDELWPDWRARVAQEIGFPCVVKPVSQGSSIGVHIVHSEDELIAASQATRDEFGHFFVEKFIPGKEITAGILRIDGADRALPLIELRPHREFYDYIAKYTPGACDFIIPAELDPQTTLKVQETALRAHHALGCFGFSRVDLRVTPQGEPYLLEINTLPGMTDTSDLPKAAAALGIGFDDLVERMLQTAFEKEQLKPKPAVKS